MAGATDPQRCHRGTGGAKAKLDGSRGSQGVEQINSGFYFGLPDICELVFALIRRLKPSFVGLSANYGSLAPSRLNWS